MNNIDPPRLSQHALKVLERRSEPLWACCDYYRHQQNSSLTSDSVCFSHPGVDPEFSSADSHERHGSSCIFNTRHSAGWRVNHPEVAPTSSSAFPPFVSVYLPDLGRGFWPISQRRQPCSGCVRMRVRQRCSGLNLGGPVFHARPAWREPGPPSKMDALVGLLR